MLQIKGIGELLEGLIPYSQRHFSRIDRLIRSTFLLDYTLIGMSVIEPVTEGDLKPTSLLHSGKNMDDAQLTNNGEEDEKQVSKRLKEKGSAKRGNHTSLEMVHTCIRRRSRVLLMQIMKLFHWKYNNWIKVVSSFLTFMLVDLSRNL